MGGKTLLHTYIHTHTKTLTHTHTHTLTHTHTHSHTHSHTHTHTHSLTHTLTHTHTHSLTHTHTLTLEKLLSEELLEVAEAAPWKLWPCTHGKQIGATSRRVYTFPFIWKTTRKRVCFPTWSLAWSVYHLRVLAS